MMNIRKFLEGIGIIPKSSTTADTAGEMEVLSSDNRLRYHDGSGVKMVVLSDSTDTLTNKTIDADSNTITNIENADIKAGAGIDATKLANGSVSNTEFQYLDGVTSGIQGQLDNKASQTALDNHINDTSDAHMATAIGNTPAGTIAATTVQAAINELDGDIQGHITDTSDAHAASAISNTPAGTIAATTVQAAVDELDGDIQGHITDAVDAHDASAISNSPSGNLAATDVQAALNELQSDVDTRATSSALSAHTGASSGVHGVTGSVVGTTDTQTLSNKTLTSPVISSISNTGTLTLPTSTDTLVARNTTDTLTNKTLTSPVLNTPSTEIVTWDDQSSTPSNPSAGFYKTYFKTDGNFYKLDSSGTETQLNGGGSSLISAQFHLNNDQNPGADQPIVFQVERWDTNSAYNTSNGEFTVPSTGYYQITAAGFAVTSGGAYYHVYVNGTKRVFLVHALSSYAGSSAVDVSVTAGDIITIRPNAAVTLQYSAGNYDATVTIVKR